MKYEFMGFDEDTLKKFWSKVDRRGPDECWPWLSSCGRKGYGHFYLIGNGSRQVKAHRFSLMVATEIYCTQLHALHSCDNPRCVNPQHLRWGTNAENMVERTERSAKWRAYVSSGKMQESAKAMNLQWGTHNGRLRRALNPSQVRYIRRLLNAGYRQRDCARWYKVSAQCINDIALGRSYIDII